MIFSCQTDIITANIPLTVKQLLSQIQTNSRNFCITYIIGLASGSRYAFDSNRARRICTTNIKFLALNISSSNALRLCIINQSISKRRNTTKVTIAIAIDFACQASIASCRTIPCIRLAAPCQTRRNIIISILCENSVINKPCAPLIKNLFQSFCQRHIARSYTCCIVLRCPVIQFSQTLYSPYLVADPVIRYRVTIYGMSPVHHTIECGYSGRICFITAFIRVSSTAGDRTICRL